MNIIIIMLSWGNNIVFYMGWWIVGGGRFFVSRYEGKFSGIAREKEKGPGKEFRLALRRHQQGKGGRIKKRVLTWVVSNW